MGPKNPDQNQIFTKKTLLKMLVSEKICAKELLVQKIFKSLKSWVQNIEVKRWFCKNFSSKKLNEKYGLKTLWVKENNQGQKI